MSATAWEGSWRTRLAERLSARGFSTISAFADSMPRASRLALAAELSATADDIAPVQVLWALLDEARATNTVEHRARDLLVRDIRADLPDGWPPPRGTTPPAARKDLVGALVNWSGGIATHLPEYESTVNTVEDALLVEDIPAGWLPSSTDDPLLVVLFRRHWREPPSTRRKMQR